MANFTKEEQKIHDTLVEYDTARKAEGYAIAYRKWCAYGSFFEGKGCKKSQEHVETMYLNPNGKALLVKVHTDGEVSAFEAVA